MRLFYIDESGQIRFGDGPRYYLLGGIVLQDTGWRELDAHLRAVLDAYRPKLRNEIFAALAVATAHAGPYWTRRALQRKGLVWATLTGAQHAKVHAYVEKRLAEELEIHAVDMFHGREIFDGVSRPTRMALMSAAVGVLEKHQPSPVCIVLDKVAHHEKYGDRAWPPDTWCFALLSDMFDEHLRKTCGGEFGMFIADTGGTDAGVARRNLRRFQTKGTPFFNNKCERVVESIHFVNSCNSSGVQLADLAVYLLKHRIEGESATRALFDRVHAACRYKAKLRPTPEKKGATRAP